MIALNAENKLNVLFLEIKILFHARLRRILLENSRRRNHVFELYSSIYHCCKCSNI